MSDVNVQTGAFDPFADENLAGGSFGWDGKLVTIIEAKTETEFIRRKAGEGQYEPVVDEKTGQPAYQNVLTIVGIAEDSEREYRERYSAGNTYAPTADGKGFIIPEGKKGLSANSAVSKFGKRLREGGFDTSKLYVNGQLDFSVLRGAQVIFQGEDQLDAKGNVKKNAKGYPQQKFFPRKYVGHRASPKANGAVTNDLRQRVVAATLTALQAAPGQTLNRPELVRKVGEVLGQGVMTEHPTLLATTLLRDEFHVDQAWVKQGSTYSIPASA